MEDERLLEQEDYNDVHLAINNNDKSMQVEAKTRKYI
jgi:hypothetical protein